eukprot:SAG31_NODE_7064_length_1799_cov_1.135882_2_plen_274_part_00
MGEFTECEQSPYMRSIQDRVSTSSLRFLDGQYHTCMTAREQEVDPQPFVEDPIIAMCRMAWERIFELTTQVHNGHQLNVCDWIVRIRTVAMVCDDYVQLDASRLAGGYQAIENPDYCATFFECEYVEEAGIIGRIVVSGTCEDIDECANNNGGCSHGCINNFGEPPTCTCPGGLENPPACDMCTNMCDCRLQFSSGNPCENGAICSNGTRDSFQCNCQGNFTGLYCETKTQQCEVGYNCPFVQTAPMRDGTLGRQMSALGKCTPVLKWTSVIQ